MTMTVTGYVGEVLGLRSSDIWMAVNQSETFNYRLEKKRILIIYMCVYARIKWKNDGI